MKYPFYPFRVRLSRKLDPGHRRYEYFYELLTMEGEEVGARIDVPVENGEPVLCIKSCVLSTM